MRCNQAVVAGAQKRKRALRLPGGLVEWRHRYILKERVNKLDRRTLAIL